MRKYCFMLFVAVLLAPSVFAQARRHAANPVPVPTFSIDAFTKVTIVRNTDPGNPGYTVWGYIDPEFYIPIYTTIDTMVTQSNGRVLESHHNTLNRDGKGLLLGMYQGPLAEDAGPLSCLIKVTIDKDNWALYKTTVEPATASSSSDSDEGAVVSVGLGNTESQQQ